ncbi:unnamed protein product [Symbiodinium necroappetens]|uniref:Uncharacterized protein n=1 Tax=Symbiodinium necroappetens TaxID=1628268 RepID=A0A813ABJ6_9DINO|nr:unnamed protein product [Symbiodinium necroappetens]
MNIFINVTGAGYDDERRNIVGTFLVERFHACMESVEVAGWSRRLVLSLFSVALCVRMLISLGFGDVLAAVWEACILLCWLLLYLLQWRLCREACQLRESVEAVQPAVAWHLWVCLPSEWESETATEASCDQQSGLRDLGKALGSLMKQMAELLQNAEKLLQRQQRLRTTSSKRSGKKGGFDALCDSNPKGISSDFSWLEDLLVAAELRRHIDPATRWAEERDIVQSDFLGGNEVSAASREEAFTHMDDLSKHLKLSAAATQRLYKQLQNRWITPKLAAAQD